MNIINCVLLVLFLLVTVALLECTSFPLAIHLLNLVLLFYLQILLIIILPASFAIFFHPQYLMILFLLLLKLRMQVFPENFFFLTMQLVFKTNFSFKDPIPGYLYANYRHLYCLNYILLLLHLIITHLVIDFIITM